MRKPTLARLVRRKKATVRRAMWPTATPRRRIHAPSARPPAPPTERIEFAASSERPISMLVRQLIRWQNTARKTSTYDAHESTCRPAATTNQPASAPANCSSATPGPEPGRRRRPRPRRPPPARAASGAAARRRTLPERLRLDRLEELTVKEGVQALAGPPTLAAQASTSGPSPAFTCCSTVGGGITQTGPASASG